MCSKADEMASLTHGPETKNYEKIKEVMGEGIGEQEMEELVPE